MARQEGSPARSTVLTLVFCCFTGKLYFFLFSAAITALLQSPLITSNAGVAEAACGAVRNLTAGNEENRAKLGAAGACEGEFPTKCMCGCWTWQKGSPACLRVNTFAAAAAAAAAAPAA